MSSSFQFRAGDRVVVKGVPKESHEWDIGTVVGRIAPKEVLVRWDRAEETYNELDEVLELVHV